VSSENLGKDIQQKTLDPCLRRDDVKKRVLQGRCSVGAALAAKNANNANVSLNENGVSRYLRFSRILMFSFV